MAQTKKTDTKKTGTKAAGKPEPKADSKSESKSQARGTIQIQYFRSKIQAPVKHKLVIKGLGFTRLNQIVVREDTPSIRGMVKTVPHLVRIVD